MPFHPDFDICFESNNQFLKEGALSEAMCFLRVEFLLSNSSGVEVISIRLFWVFWINELSRHPRRRAVINLIHSLAILVKPNVITQNLISESKIFSFCPAFTNDLCYPE